MRKGFWHLVDAVLACLVLVGFMAAISGTSIITPSPENLDRTAYEMLKGLDDRGYVRSYAASHDYSGLNSRVQIYSHNHSVQICDYGGSCYGTVPSEGNVWVATYISAGNSVYQPAVVRLFLWE